jgi:hypothetical protein
MNIPELDAIAWRYEREWGIGRLPGLVSPETAERWRAAMALLDAAAPPKGKTWDQVRASLARGWGALATEARARGHEPLPPPVAETEYEPGRLFAIALDDAHRHALDARNKNEGRKVAVWTVAEVAVIIQSIPVAATIKDLFPGAQVLPPRLPSLKGRWVQDDPADILDQAGQT